MSSKEALFSRHAEHMATEALGDTRVVVVNGARQVGKQLSFGDRLIALPMAALWMLDGSTS